MTRASDDWSFGHDIGHFLDWLVCFSDGRWTYYPVRARGRYCTGAGKKNHVLLKMVTVWVFFPHLDKRLDFCPSGDSCQIAVTQDGQIQYLPVRTKQQIVSPEDLEAAANSVTGLFTFSVTKSIFLCPLLTLILLEKFSTFIRLSTFMNISYFYIFVINKLVETNKWGTILGTLYCFCYYFTPQTSPIPSENRKLALCLKLPLKVFFC